MRVAYIHGRPAPHPMHKKFAESVNAEFHFVDFIMRWQDQNRTTLYRLLSWFICGLRFPKRRNYNIFLVDNLHFMPVLMKIFNMISGDQKIVAHMGSHTLYFIYSHRFSKISEFFHIWALKKYDALICEGEMAAQLVKNILGKKTPKLYIVYNGIPKEHFPDTTNVNLNSKNILFIGNGPGKERLWYKGLDLMLDAFEIALKKNHDLRFTIVGTWEEKIISELLTAYGAETRTAVVFKKATMELGKEITNHSLYLHCARGEAYGITILIAMANGLPVIVSNWTGAKEVVSKVDKSLIVSLDKNVIAERINWYFDLDPDKRQGLSLRSTQVATLCTESDAVDHYQKRFSQLIKDFGLN
ncbi:MAG: glycosyltransferase [Cyclobacteriaceae bacterium]